MNRNLTLTDFPIVPYVRHADFAVRDPWSIPERRILDYLLIYVQEGQFVVNIKASQYNFREGEFCLIQPNDIHALQGITKTITPFVHLDFFYNPEREKGFSTRPSQLDLSAYSHLIQPRLNDFSDIQIPIRLEPSQPILFRDTLLNLIGNWKNYDIISQLEAQKLAMELILHIFKDYSREYPQIMQTPQPLNWITSFLSFHLADPVTIDDMAKRANLSTSRFSKVFRQHFGQSPYQYLMLLRIKHAQELMANSNLTLKQIAEYCGFTTIHHFSKAFKKATSDTPGEYRKSSK